MTEKVQILSRNKVHTGISTSMKPVVKKDTARIIAEAYQAQAQDAVDERMTTHRKYEIQSKINTQMLHKIILIRSVASRMGDAGKEIIDILNS